MEYGSFQCLRILPMKTVTLILAASNNEFDSVEQRIYTLTSFLETVNWGDSPTTTDQNQNSTFLRHLAMFFTCGDQLDSDAERFIVVTGGLIVERLTLKAYGPLVVTRVRLYCRLQQRWHSCEFDQNCISTYNVHIATTNGPNIIMLYALESSRLALLRPNIFTTKN